MKFSSDLGHAQGMYGRWNYMGSLHVQYRRWCIHTTNHVQCSGISKDMYRQNKWNNLEMETINIICCNSIKSPFWKCCEMDSHPHPRGMILRVILSQLRRLTLTELLELMQAIIETMNDRYANGCIGDTYDSWPQWLHGWFGSLRRSRGNGATSLIYPSEPTVMHV